MLRKLTWRGGSAGFRVSGILGHVFPETRSLKPRTRSQLPGKDGKRLLLQPYKGQVLIHVRQFYKNKVPCSRIPALSDPIWANSV